MIKKLNDICSFVSGNAWKAAEFVDEGIPIIRINNMNTNDNDFVYWQGDYDKRYLINKGDLLVSLSGTIKTFQWNGPEALLNQRIVKVIANPDTNQDWVYYQISHVIEEIANKGKHAVIKNVSVNDLKNFEIDVPDFQTQNTIVAILDKASALVKKNELLLLKIEQLEKSYFKATFGDSFINPKDFPLEPISKLAINIIDCPHSTPKYMDDITDYPCIRTSEIRNGTIDWDSMKYLNKQGYEKRIERYTPVEGDLIFAREGTVGDAAIIPKDLNISLGQRVMLFNLNKSKVTSVFFWALLRSDGIQHKIKSKIIGATVSRINISEVKKIECPIPPISLQEDFTNKLQNLLLLKVKKTKALNNSQSLLKSILQRAFSGKLNLNVSVELDALLEEIDLQKPENDLYSILSNEEYVNSLVERLNTQDFENQVLYDKAKHAVFQLLKTDEILAQKYDEDTKSLKLVVK